MFFVKKNYKQINIYTYYMLNIILLFNNLESNAIILIWILK
jgi:hypothetical protein